MVIWINVLSKGAIVLSCEEVCRSSNQEMLPTYDRLLCKCIHGLITNSTLRTWREESIKRIM